MAYNRLNFPGQHPDEDDLGAPPMDPRYHGRSPSPGQPLHGYTLEDGPYRPQQAPLQIPMGPGDRLDPQPTYSVENIDNSHNHNDAYETRHQIRPQNYPYASNDYAISPEEHHDAYYTQPYQPSPHDERPPMSHLPSDDHQPYYDDDDDDRRPIIQPDNPYGPNPQAQPEYTDPQPEYADQYDAAQPRPSPAPIRRWKTVKEVQLFNGNLVLDCPIPPRLLNQVPHATPPERDEFTHMRYSAATCDPSEFYDSRFTLRQRLFAKPRHTELFIVITMYNEDDFLFARTLIGVFKNIEHMCGRNSSKTWGKEAWKKIVVCVVSDGRAKINPRTRAVLAGLGVYQDGIAKQQVSGKDVTAHIYEYTTQMGLELKGKTVSLRKSATPVQMLFCLKEKNQKKINSHRWFFQAFGRVLDPNICVLLDAGTKPGKDSIYHLWKAFDLEPMCAGACGEIKVMLSAGRKLINPLVATQNFEYKMSNILDKPLESAFGFISVLPGAFSAYRYIALQNDKTGAGPLEKYFAGEKMHGANAGIFTANMYLAEDRILCFELVSKRNCRWILQYVKSSTGETDVPDTMAEFIAQRRRWLNGSFFAAVYALAHFYQVNRSDHSFLRKMMLFVEFIYQTVNMIFAWFAIGNFFLVFHILTNSLGDKELLSTTGKILGVVFEWLYIATLLTCFVLALGNRPQGSNKFYMTMVYFWVGIMLYLMFATIFITVRSIQIETAENGFTAKDLFKNNLFFTLIISMASTYLMWFIISFLFFDPWHLFTCFIQYLLLTPTYINILNVYAFCNTHDITWGTKGDDKAEKLPSANLKPGGKVDVAIPQDDGDLNAQYEHEMALISVKAPKEKRVFSESEKQEDYYKGFRSAVVLVWMFCNFALGAVVLSAGGLERVSIGKEQEQKNQRATIYMAVVLWSVAGLSAFRFIGALWFLIVRVSPNPLRFTASKKPKPQEPLRSQPNQTPRSTSPRQFASSPRFSFGPAPRTYDPNVTVGYGHSSSPLIPRPPPRFSSPRPARRKDEIEEDQLGVAASIQGTSNHSHRNGGEIIDEPPSPTSTSPLHKRRRLDAISISSSPSPSPPQTSSPPQSHHLPQAHNPSSPPHPPTHPHPFILSPKRPSPTPISNPLTRPPFFLPPRSPSPPASRNLHPIFSPHRRSGPKFLPGGMAHTVRDWVIDIAASIPATTDSEWDLRFKVGEARSGERVSLVEEARNGGEEGRRWMFVGMGDNHSHREVRTGVMVGIRRPVWDVDVGGEGWVVGVDWGVLDG
ncbi:MAG: hypothetical protein Q9178_004535 [Gyalolechia marmorata]